MYGKITAALHMAWKGTKSGTSQIRKKCHNPDDLRILALFSDLQNSTSKYPKNKQSISFFWAIAVRISVRAPRQQKGRHFARPVRVLKMEFHKSKKSTRILRFPGFWNFLRICEIPLVSSLTDNAKCRSFFRPQLFWAVWAPRRQKWHHFSLTLKVLTIGIFQI